MDISYYEVIGYKKSKNGKFTIIIERDNKNKIIYTIYNNELKIKRILFKN
jgi:hypothetical protein